MKADLRFEAFLATGWFIKPTADLNAMIRDAMNQVIQYTFGKDIVRKFKQTYVSVYDLSKTHFDFAHRHDFHSLSWLKEDYYDILMVNDSSEFDPLIPPEFIISDDLTMGGIIRDLEYLKHPGDGIKTIIFLDNFLYVPFFQKELKLFDALDYDIYIYSIDGRTLAYYNDFNGGNDNAQNKITDVSGSDHNDSITDFIVSRKEYDKLRENAIEDDVN